MLNNFKQQFAGPNSVVQMGTLDTTSTFNPNPGLHEISPLLFIFFIVIVYTLFSISNYRLKLVKIQNDKQHPVTKLLLFENLSHSLCTLSSKNDRTYSENKQKVKYVYIHETIRLIIMKMKVN